MGRCDAQFEAETRARQADIESLEAEIDGAEATVYQSFARRVGVESIKQLEESMVERAAARSKRRAELTERRTKLEAQRQHEIQRDVAGQVAAVRQRQAALEKNLRAMRAEVEQAASAYSEAAAKVSAMADRKAEVCTGNVPGYVVC